MNLADERLKQLDNPSLTPDESAALRSEVAADFIHAGQYETAREALGGLWRGIGERPDLEGLSERTAAEVLLQAGALSGRLGASGQVAGAQGAAKDLISESVALFERLGEVNREALARADLALCYWREGAYDEARVLLEEAAARITNDSELKAKTVQRLVVVESSAGRYSDALRLLTDSAPLFEESGNDALMGGFHNELAIVLQLLAKAERREDYSDRAILEYTAAAYHYERAGHQRYVALSENNLAFLLYKLGRHRDAHEHLDRAQLIYTKLKDSGSVAQVDDTRARVLLAEQKYAEANRVLAGAIESFERGGDSALLADALTLQGVVWARLGGYESSTAVLKRAAEIGEGVGAYVSAGRALLTLIEVHGARRTMPLPDVYAAYLRADELLQDTQDADDAARLRACARVVMRRLAGLRIKEKNFTLHGALHELEARLIAEALEDAGGSVTKAARLLGLPHQTLGTMLNTRHRPLLRKRTPAKNRKRSIIQRPE